MAASATTAAAAAAAATPHFCSSTSSRTSNNGSRGSCHFKLPDARKWPRRVVVVRSSGSEVSAEETAATSETVESEETTPAEVPQGPPSLISPLNVDKALRGIAITDADHYGRLGLRRGCSYDQVFLAYKKKVDELLSQGLSEEELNTNLELLKESYSILASVEERRLYDWSLARTEKPDRYMWPFEVDITQTPTGTPPPQEPEDVGPTKLVGYFIFGWFILSSVLSIVFNR
ncbi:NAD(P)H-quinone oxidoreductase subunit U, chloroplastic [Coffea arabica]|uniref:NAD(P)H-quinone oxidoreductase subunit U, chloroplastic n=1 Tax=Coffea arabica TaxID=13443 RepID=A0A6P6U0L1_COFAR|nr:NAD(P)H-quinone oxidoreductase subunit U, chloroplastic-like [Coffea arabica]